MRKSITFQDLLRYDHEKVGKIGWSPICFLPLATNHWESHTAYAKPQLFFFFYFVMFWRHFFGFTLVPMKASQFSSWKVETARSKLATGELALCNSPSGPPPSRPREGSCTWFCTAPGRLSSQFAFKTPRNNVPFSCLHDAISTATRSL